MGPIRTVRYKISAIVLLIVYLIQTETMTPEMFQVIHVLWQVISSGEPLTEVDLNLIDGLTRLFHQVRVAQNQQVSPKVHAFFHLCHAIRIGRTVIVPRLTPS